MSQKMPPHPPMGERDREILREVVLAHILSAEPVSSRAIARRNRLGLSAASIRNVMADLEEWGFLTQPHTSAGRVPTREGYHLFIDSLMQTQQPSLRERRQIEESLRSVPPDAAQLLAATLLVLKDLSHQVSIVMTPAASETTLKAVELVPVSDRQVLCVVVSGSGFVDNKLVTVREPLSRDELQWISNYLSENFAGLPLREIRERLLVMMSEDRAQVDRMLSLTIDLARQGLEERGERQLLVDGTSEVLAHPELADITRVRQLFDTFSRRARLVSFLNQLLDTEGVRVVIGADSALTSQLDFSLITTSYGVGRQKLGTVSVFGPSRMEYPRLIPLVHYLGETLSRVLAGGLEGRDLGTLAPLARGQTAEN